MAHDHCRMPQYFKGSHYDMDLKEAVAVAVAVGARGG